jgi:hypothetical protein
MSAIMNQGTSAFNAYICAAYVLRDGPRNLVLIVCKLAHLHLLVLRLSPRFPSKFAFLPITYPLDIAPHRSRATAPFFSIRCYTLWVRRSHSLPTHVVHSCTPPLPPDRGACCATTSHARSGLAFFVGVCTLSVLSHSAYQSALLA